MTKIPRSLPPGLCPGGWVIHWYDAATGRLIHMTTLGPEDLTAEVADADRAAIRRSGCETVGMLIFDGDTGAAVHL